MGGAKGGFKLINYVGGPIFAAFKAIKDDLMYLKQSGNTFRETHRPESIGAAPRWIARLSLPSKKRRRKLAIFRNT